MACADGMGAIILVYAADEFRFNKDEFWRIENSIAP